MSMYSDNIFLENVITWIVMAEPTACTARIG